MLYHYRAADASGKMVEDDFDANALQDVLQHLSTKGLRPVSVTVVKQATSGFFGLFGGKITLADKVFLTKYLALMLRVGTDLLSAINILIADSDKPVMRNFLLEVRENLMQGRPFYEAFARYPAVFSATFVSLVKAAEASGSLQSTFEDLSNSLVGDADLISQVRAALIYPLVLLSMSLIITIFLVTFALPKVVNVFSGSGITPPIFSRVVFAVGLFIGNNLIALLSGLVIFIVAFYFFFFKTQTGKRVFDQIITHLPVIKDIYRDIAIQRMASTMASLMKAGLPIVQTITVAADTVSLVEFKFALMRIATDGLEKGLTIGEAFRRETVFPTSVTSLIAISEKAGHLEEVLGTLADFYKGNIDASIKTGVALLEPALLLIMGVLVGTIALALIVPIYQLTTSF
jgi:type II secretory pathway component PulF